MPSASSDEMLALIMLERMLRRAATPVPQFLNWVADRLVMVHGDDENVDFVNALRERANQLYEIGNLLGVYRGPVRLP